MSKPIASVIAIAFATLCTTTPAAAQSDDSYIGNVFTTAADYCPANTIEAAGQTLPINQYQALFALLGFRYGGNNSSTFGLPDLRARMPIGANPGPNGMAPNLPSKPMGTYGGSELQQLTISQLAPHTHDATAVSQLTVSARLHSTSGSPQAPTAQGAMLASYGSTTNVYSASTTPNYTFDSNAISTQVAGSVSVTNGVAGQGAPFSIRDPYIVLRYCIVYNGVYPSRP